MSARERLDECLNHHRTGLAFIVAMSVIGVGVALLGQSEAAIVMLALVGVLAGGSLWQERRLRLDVAGEELEALRKRPPPNV